MLGSHCFSCWVESWLHRFDLLTPPEDHFRNAAASRTSHPIVLFLLFQSLPFSSLLFPSFLVISYLLFLTPSSTLHLFASSLPLSFLLLSLSFPSFLVISYHLFSFCFIPALLIHLFSLSLPFISFLQPAGLISLSFMRSALPSTLFPPLQSCVSLSYLVLPFLFSSLVLHVVTSSNVFPSTSLACLLPACFFPSHFLISVCVLSFTLSSLLCPLHSFVSSLLIWFLPFLSWHLFSVPHLFKLPSFSSRCFFSLILLSLFSKFSLLCPVSFPIPIFLSLHIPAPDPYGTFFFP